MKFLTFFPRLHGMPNRPLRRVLMVLTLPLVLVETYINATIGLVRGFQYYWNVEWAPYIKTENTDEP